MKVVHIVKALSTMLSMPIRLRRNPDHPAVTPEHYLVPELASSLETTTTKAADVPVVKSPPNGWTKDWPPLVLTGCDEPLVEGAPDIRGVWQVYKGPLKGHIERNEQAGNRVVTTGGGLIHDMTVDGTFEGAMKDQGVGGAQIAVVGRFGAGQLNYYLNDKRRMVTRYRDGDDLVWRWGPYLNRLRRLTGPEDAVGSTEGLSPN